MKARPIFIPESARDILAGRQRFGSCDLLRGLRTVGTGKNGANGWLRQNDSCGRPVVDAAYSAPGSMRAYSSAVNVRCR